VFFIACCNEQVFSPKPWKICAEKPTLIPKMTSPSQRLGYSNNQLKLLTS